MQKLSQPLLLVEAMCSHSAGLQHPWLIHCTCASCRADNALYLAVTRVILMDMYNHLAPQDKQYFRESREALFGQKLEEVGAQDPYLSDQLHHSHQSQIHGI